MKSYTDLEQSIVLSRILSPESADMGWNVFVDDSTRCLPIDDWDLSKNGEGGAKFIPCWSLAALLSVLPRFIKFKGNKYYLRFMKEYVEYANDEISITGRCLHTTGNDNLVDACVEMTLKLHELNLL